MILGGGRYGVGPNVGNLDDWTAATPGMVFAALRTSLQLLDHCSLGDPQLPSICLRIRRLTHYFLGTDGEDDKSEVGESDLWTLNVILHIRNKVMSSLSIYLRVLLTSNFCYCLPNTGAQLMEMRRAFYGNESNGGRADTDEPMEEAFGGFGTTADG